jgi:pimeloyl-ACP methyl ester carboxylesterase
MIHTPHTGRSVCPATSRAAGVRTYAIHGMSARLAVQGLKGDLVLIGYTLGASIALQYGLDYPDEVRGLVLMTPDGQLEPGASVRYDAGHRPWRTAEKEPGGVP